MVNEVNMHVASPATGGSHGINILMHDIQCGAAWHIQLIEHANRVWLQPLLSG